MVRRQRSRWRWFREARVFRPVIGVGGSRCDDALCCRTTPATERLVSLTHEMSTRDITLVTGASGFLGTHLVEQLLADGVRVRGLVRSASRAARSLPSGVEIVEGDVTDRDSVRRAMQDVAVVQHMASTFRTAKVPAAVHRAVHVDGTRIVLEEATQAGVDRVVHTSTCGVHGDVKSIPGTETSPYAPGDAYQITKLEGEQLALAYGREHGLAVSVVRPTTMYGPGDLRLLKMFRGIARRRFPIIGSGNVLTHFAYVTDVVQGLTLAASAPAAVGEPFLIGGNESRTLNDVVAMIASALDTEPLNVRLPVWPFYVAGVACEVACMPFGIEPPIFRRRVAFFTKNRAFSVDKARRLLGYEPRVGLEEGIRETARWYASEGLLGPSRHE